MLVLKVAWILLVVLGLLRPRILPALLVAGAVFPVTAVIIVGRFGLTPYYLTAVVASLHVMAKVARGRLRVGSRSTTSMAVLFAVWSVASAFLLPLLFQGMPVYNPNIGLDAQYGSLTPLHFISSNVGQAGYLVLNIGVLLFLQQYGELGRLTRSVKLVTWLAVATMAYQALSQVFGLPFPDFGSMPGYNYLDHSTIALGGVRVHRLNGAFGEPSGAAQFLVSILVFSLTLPKPTLLLAVATTVGTLSALSSTGLVMLVLVFGGALMSLRYFLKRMAGVSLAQWTAVIVVVLTVALGAFVSGHRVIGAYNSLVLEKGRSASFLHRTSADLASLSIAEKSFGLGVGLGSNRPSSLLPTLLSTVGIPGTVLFILLLGTLVPALSSKQRRPFAWALFAYVVAKLISGPDITSPLIWLLGGCVLAKSDGPTHQLHSGRSRRLPVSGPVPPP